MLVKKTALAWLSLAAVMLLIGGCSASPVAQQASTSTAVVGPSPTTLEVPSATSGSPTPWVPPTALAGTPIPGAEATLTAAPALKKTTLTIVNDAGTSVNMSVEIADTDASRELGLMFRSSMDPDAGMLFDFGSDTTSGFWMENTILPLSIAFITADGKIISVQDMKALDTTVINAPGSYRYALETNLGFFAANQITAGDTVTIQSSQGVVIPGMPVVGK